MNFKTLKLDQLDQNKQITKESYTRDLKKYQLGLLNLQLRLKESKRTVIIVLEGPDAAGKGGAIKRTLERLDPRLVRVYSTPKPTAEEYRHHYMWRFWNKIPPVGELSVFDRSWYGRVLVERVEKFATKDQWGRAYSEIAGFERSLYDEGAVVIKFWMHISQEEQLKRFNRRSKDPLRQWKLTDEDWRNRENHAEYVKAVEEMLKRTDRPEAPWNVIPGESKRHARVAVLERSIEAIEAGMRQPPRVRSNQECQQTRTVTFGVAKQTKQLATSPFPVSQSQYRLFAGWDGSRPQQRAQTKVSGCSIQSSPAGSPPLATQSAAANMTTSSRSMYSRLDQAPHQT